MTYIYIFIINHRKNDKEFKKQLFKDLNKVKNDLINYTDTCDEKYKEWLNENRYKVVPEKEDIKETLYYDVKCSPQKYIKNMIYMNKQLENIEAKMFQFMPLRNDIIPKNIVIDTKSLIELLLEKDKNTYLKDITNYKDYLWEKFFTIKVKVKGYSFDNTIITDGYSCSIRMVNNKFKDKIDEKKNKMRVGRKNAKKEDKVKKEIKQIEKVKTNKPTTKEEFPYIDEVDKEELKGNCIYIDPGKRSLLSIIDDFGNKLNYTNKQRIHDTKRLKYQSLIHNFRTKLGITDIENTLSKYNSKTCNLMKFKEFIKEKNEVNKCLFEKYQDFKFRRIKWYGYINKQRANSKMLNQIETKFGKDIIVIHGDWTIGKQMRNFISTPNLGIKRELKQRFTKVYNIDEFRTSCLNYKTEERCENLYLYGKDLKKRKMHSVLTYKMENGRKGCINRDINGCMNMKKLFNHYMEKGEWLEKYKRGVELEIKDANPVHQEKEELTVSNSVKPFKVQLHH
jgi:hypothetical protein